MPGESHFYTPDNAPSFRARPEQNPSIQKIDGDFRGKDIVSIEQFDAESLESFFNGVDRMKAALERRDPELQDVLKGNHLTLLFYEPSTRTMASFDAAAQRLGATTTVITNPQAFSSAAKGESLKDSLTIYAGYSDGIILRHPEVGSAREAAEYIEKPVINAGDGNGEHPTQALLDLYTIREHVGRLEEITVGFVGDNKNGRTVHSLLDGLANFDGNTAYLLSPPELKLSDEKVAHYKDLGLIIRQVENPHEIPPHSLDVAYWTRIQKERFNSEEDYKRLQEESNGRYRASREFLDSYGESNIILMHPLPRVDEIPIEMDSDPRSIYFHQAENGLIVRMEILRGSLGGKEIT